MSAQQRRKRPARNNDDEYTPQRFSPWVRAFVWIFLVIFIFSVAGGILIIGGGGGH